MAGGGGRSRGGESVHAVPGRSWAPVSRTRDRRIVVACEGNKHLRNVRLFLNDTGIFFPRWPSRRGRDIASVLWWSVVACGWMMLDVVDVARSLEMGRGSEPASSVRSSL
jgi:hypothetical protein